MYNSDTYALSGTPDELSRVLRCPVAEFNIALSDLQRHNAANVEVRNGVVTFVSRRLEREEKRRENGRLRVNEHRKRKVCNTEVASASVFASEYLPPKGKESEKGDAKTFALLKLEVGKHFGRKVTDRWNYEEEWNLVEVCKRPGAEAEWLEIVAWRNLAEANGEKLRQSVKSLLEGWGSELDRARNYRPEKLATRQSKPRAAASILDRSNEKPFETSAGVTSEWQKMKANLK